tara:strand:- start:30294 stop:31055 length:762 start_codon:yes stop_codon:yes gene_type:complete
MTTLQSQFNQISEQLFSTTPLSYFSLSITDLEKKELAFIASNPNFNISMFSDDFPLLAPFLDEGYYSASGIYHKLPSLFEENNFSNVFYIIKKEGNTTLCYTFASPLNMPSMINFYFNNLEFLEKFIHLFNEQGKDLIQSLRQSMHTVPHHIKPVIYEELLHTKIIGEPFIITKFYNKKSEVWIKLSERERNTFVLAAIHGKTAIEIGQALQISPKTVENYLDSLRHKLGAKSKKELLKRAIDIGLIRLQSFV